jgi:hypothetical protein
VQERAVDRVQTPTLPCLCVCRCWGLHPDISPRFAACFFLSKKAELHAGVLLKKTHRHSGRGLLLSGKNLRSKYQMLGCQRVHMICAASDLKKVCTRQHPRMDWKRPPPLHAGEGWGGVRRAKLASSRAGMGLRNDRTVSRDGFTPPQPSPTTRRGGG